MRLEGGFERGGRIRVAECLRQIVPDRWASIRKRSFTKCFCVYTGGDKGSCVRLRVRIALYKKLSIIVIIIKKTEFQITCGIVCAGE